MGAEAVPPPIGVPQQAVPPPIGVRLAAVPASPAETLLQKVGRIKVVLEIDTALSLKSVIKAANELMGIAPAEAGSLPSQVDHWDLAFERGTGRKCDQASR